MRPGVSALPTRTVGRPAASKASARGCWPWVPRARTTVSAETVLAYPVERSRTSAPLSVTAVSRWLVSTTGAWGVMRLMMSLNTTL